jgi:hypothetical protein
MVDSGLGVEDVVNEETTLNLTGGDWREFSKLPAGSITRAEFLYKKCLERNPQLSTRFSAYKTAHNKTDKPQKTKTEKDEPAKNKPEKEPEITQDDILDEDEQDVKSLLLGDI